MRAGREKRGTGGGAYVGCMGTRPETASLLVREEPRDLILQAFERAKSKGIQEWRRMTVAVLKNRLLDLTKGTFHERAFGASTFSDFVRQYPELLCLDASTRPPTVVLLDVVQDQERPKTTTPSPLTGRIRRDLWESIMDFTSGRSFGWDATTGQARPLLPEEELPRLPTITAEQFTSWRDDFLKRLGPGLSAEELSRLQVWRDRRLPTVALPPALRKQWNDDIKTRVSLLLREWFDSNKLSVPGTLLEMSRPDRAAQPSEAGVQELRALATEVVQCMSLADLQNLNLPLSAVYRLFRARGGDR